MNRNKINIVLFSGFFLASAASSAAPSKTAEYRAQDFVFRYPTGCKLSAQGHASVIRLTHPSQSPYWVDEIVIRKHNKKTDECDLPNDTRPDDRDHRKIAGRRASAYSGEDAAMNRSTRTKGYIIETRTACWRFELVRKSRPFHKFDLPRNELKRLERQSARDAKTADAAFRMILDTFALQSRGR